MDKVPVEDKMEHILKAIEERGNLVVAFSGGVDSTVVTRLAHDALGVRAIAVTADSESLPRSELEDAKMLASLIGIEHRIVQHSELANEMVVCNPKDRCYHCRKELTGILREVAREKGFDHLADGVNISDLGEHRPGIKAADEAGIWHPFVEFKVTKKELRQMAKTLGLPIHNKPAAACLSSRIPYGEIITKDKLSQVEMAEEALKKEGFGHVRVRHHNDIARIEVPTKMMERFQDPEVRERMVKAIKALGFKYVTLDLVGYRPGSMDEVIGEL